jgi:glycosyltransferase involved in cell wall biosynthesis
MEFSLIVPIFNEEENINILYQRCKAILVTTFASHEIIFINDASKDNSFLLIKQLAQQDPTIKYIDLSRNFGHQIAVMAGLDCASGQTIGIIDADLQDPPELIAEMYQKMKSGYEVVYAQRQKREGETWFKKRPPGYIIDCFLLLPISIFRWIPATLDS